MKLDVVPVQLLAFGTIVIVAGIRLVVGFNALKAGIFPVPLAAKPIEGVLFVQSKVVPATLLVKGTTLHNWLLHNKMSATGSVVGTGLTVMVNVLDKPSQELAVGVTVIVAIIGENPVFKALKEGKFPVPEAVIPMLVKSLVQL